MTGGYAPWLALPARIAAATVGAYAGSMLVAILLSRLLPMALAPATMASMLLSFWVFAAIAMWAFIRRDPLRALLELGALCGVCLLGIAVI